MIFLHGGFAFSSGDFDMARPFLDAGFAVMTPTFRGENGNPGSFELFLGEVDDVVSATRWLAQQQSVDNTRLYVIGHSTGAALAALVATRADSGLKRAGAIAGLYDDSLFNSLGDAVPFDTSDQSARQSRLFLPQASSLRTPLTFYLDTATFGPATISQLDAIASEQRIPLSARLVDGDHFTIVPRSIDLFVAEIHNVP